MTGLQNRFVITKCMCTPRDTRYSRPSSPRRCRCNEAGKPTETVANHLQLFQTDEFLHRCTSSKNRPLPWVAWGVLIYYYMFTNVLWFCVIRRCGDGELITQVMLVLHHTRSRRHLLLSLLHH